MSDKFRETVGRADLCELLAAAFAFPTEELATALVDGSFLDDAVGALEDAGARADAVVAVRGELAMLLNDEELGDALRKGSSLLYFAPGAQVPVFPYESAFRHRAMGAAGTPALFRSPVTLDVERQMREAGVVPMDARAEPADSVWNEFMLLSYLFGKQAEAVEADDAEAEARWAQAAARFWDEHGAQWLPAFMAKTNAEAAKLTETTWGRPYAALATFGTTVCELLETATAE